MIFPFQKNITYSGGYRSMPEFRLAEGILHDDSDLAQVVVQAVKAFVKYFLENYEGQFSDDHAGEWRGWDLMWMATLPHLCRELAGLECINKGEPLVEKTVALLLRSSDPQPGVMVNHKSTTVTLKNVKYRLYRENDVKSCSFRVVDPGPSLLVKARLSPGKLAELLLAVDTALPDIRRAMDELQAGMRERDLELKARLKAKEIERLTIQTLLDDTLDPMNIDGQFQVVDGKVHLSLRKTLTADLIIPMERLREFLSDPEGIESTLVPEKAEEKFGKFENFM